MLPEVSFNRDLSVLIRFNTIPCLQTGDFLKHRMQEGSKLMGKYQRRCLFCAQLFEVEDETTQISGEKPKMKSICPLCEARIKKEAGDTQKEPKPM
jgi:hypothetical protein